MSENNLRDTKQCKYCRSDIDMHATYCPNCRKKQGKTKKCPYCKTQILATEKVSCPNCGKNLKNIKLITGIVIFVGICLMIGFASQNNGNNIGGGNSNKFSSKIVKVMNVDKAQAEEIVKVLDSVGVSNINEIARDEGLDDYYWNKGADKGYRLAYSGDDVEDVNRSVIVNINADGTVLAIKMAKYNGTVLYENGQVKDNLKNYVMTDNDRSTYKRLSENLMLNVLKSPSTAKFPAITEYKFGKDKGIVTVQGYVDSQNSFGATVRGEFQVQFNGETATSLIFEGKEYIK